MADLGLQTEVDTQAEANAEAETLAAALPDNVEIQIIHPRAGRDELGAIAKCDRFQIESSVSFNFVQRMGLVNDPLEEDLPTCRLTWVVLNNGQSLHTHFVICDDQEDDIVLGHDDCSKVATIIHLAQTQLGQHPVWYTGTNTFAAAKARKIRAGTERQEDEAEDNLVAEEQRKRDIAAKAKAKAKAEAEARAEQQTTTTTGADHYQSQTTS